MEDFISIFAFDNVSIRAEKAKQLVEECNYESKESYLNFGHWHFCEIC